MHTTQQVKDLISEQLKKNGLELSLDCALNNQCLLIDGLGLSCIFYPQFLAETSKSYFDEISADENLAQGEIKLPFSKNLICEPCALIYSTESKPKEKKKGSGFDQPLLLDESSDSPPAVTPKVPNRPGFCDICNRGLKPAPVKEPRRTAWYGQPGLTYTYSGKVMSPLPWTTSLLRIKTAIGKELSINHLIVTDFTSVLINEYRNGNDYLGWHSDNEKELGNEPVIASISLGEVRTFQFRLKDDHKKKIQIELNEGSLLVMRGKTQELWQHQIPKRSSATAVINPRINLTFRHIQP
ncbi:MAG: alpha-ketoglutarate-dependent dioxygenase AlkB family protein [Holophagaceae bacterium]